MEMEMIPGTSELIIIFAAILLLFGGSRLPQLGGAIGEAIRNFKKGIKSGDDEEEQKKLTKKTDEPNDSAKS